MWVVCVASKNPVVERNKSVPPINTVEVSLGKNRTIISYESWLLYLSKSLPVEGKLAERSTHLPPALSPLPERYLYFHNPSHSTCPKKFVSGIPALSVLARK